MTDESRKVRDEQGAMTGNLMRQAEIYAHDERGRSACRAYPLTRELRGVNYFRR